MEPERFGQLVFGGSDLFIEELDSGGGRLGLNEAKVKLRTLSKSPAPADVELEVNGLPASRAHAVAPVQGTVSLALPYVLTKPGPAWVEAVVLDKTSHARLASARADFVAPEAVDLRLSGSEFASNAKDAQVEILVMLGEGTLRRTRLSLKLLDNQNHVARKMVIGRLESERLTGRLDLSRLKEGVYTLVCEALETPNLKRGEVKRELTIRKRSGDMDGFESFRRSGGAPKAPETPPPPTPKPAAAPKPAKTPKPAKPSQPVKPAPPANTGG